MKKINIVAINLSYSTWKKNKKKLGKHSYASCMFLSVLFSPVKNIIYYINSSEIPAFLLLLKNHMFIARSERTIFIFHVWGYWCRHGY